MDTTDSDFTFAQIPKLFKRNLPSFMLAFAAVELASQVFLVAQLFDWKDYATIRQGQERQGHCIKYTFLREVHSSLKWYPLEFNSRLFAHNLTDIQLKMQAMTIVRKLLPCYERNVSGLSRVFFWNRNKISASGIKFCFILNEFMTNNV